MDNVNVTKLWIERFVIGLRLCPFAQFSFFGNTIYYGESASNSMSEQLNDLMDVAVKMNSVPQSEISNAFLIFNQPLSFSNMLLLKERFDMKMEKEDMGEIFQAVVFHPEFQFGDEHFHAPGNFTNRSPLPMIHILREDEVAHAIETTEDVDDIPFRNKEVLEKLDIKNISEVFEEEYIEKIKAYI